MFNIFNFFKKKPIEIELTKELLDTPKPFRKPYDTTPLTKGMYDFVIEMKAAQEEHNTLVGDSTKYETTEDLCAYLNMVFNTNFSRSKLTRIWTGKVNRENLPDGIKYKIPF